MADDTKAPANTAAKIKDADVKEERRDAVKQNPAKKLYELTSTGKHIVNTPPIA